MPKCPELCNLPKSKGPKSLNVRPSSFHFRVKSLSHLTSFAKQLPAVLEVCCHHGFILVVDFSILHTQLGLCFVKRNHSFLRLPHLCLEHALFPRLFSRSPIPIGPKYHLIKKSSKMASRQQHPSHLIMLTCPSSSSPRSEFFTKKRFIEQKSHVN